MTTRVRRRLWAAVMAAAACIGCEATGPGFRSIVLEVVPSPIELDALGASETVAVSVVDGRGRPVLGSRLTFTIDDPGIATVDASGRITAVAPGSTSLLVVATGLGFIEARATAAVEVTPVPVALEIVDGDDQSGPAGETLPVDVQVRAVDRLGSGVTGVAIRFEPTAGSGSTVPDQAQTDALGLASAAWTLGPTAGPIQQLHAAIEDSGAAAVTFEALGLPGPAAAIEVVGGVSQYGVRSQLLAEPIQIVVRDAFGNAVGGAPVAFSTDGSGGAAEPASTVTELSGTASTRWRLGATAGRQTLTVSAGGATGAAVEATATEPPAALIAVSSTTISGSVASPVASPPSIRVVDAAGTAVPSTPVTFEVTAGGGSIGEGGASVAVRLSDDAGVATAGAWTLGTTAGSSNQVVRASVPGVTPAVFTATARAGPPADVVLVAGDGQTGAVTQVLPAAIAVRVDDAWGNAVEGADVTFSPSDGFTLPPTATTSTTGQASTAWTLGPVAGSLRLEVEAGGAGGPRAEVSATATGTAATCALQPPTPGFDVQVCWVGAVDPDVAAALDTALQRWESVVVGDLEDVRPNGDHASCVSGAPWVTGPTLDDLVLYVTVDPIDGAGGGLAGALPCFVREGSGLPTFARLRVDRDDVAGLLANGRLVDVVSHEVAHALGFGTLWGGAGLLAEPAAGTSGPSPDTHFTGTRAIAEFDAAGGAARTAGAKVPVQNRGGAGIVDTHWRETVMGDELMTAELNAAGGNPLSRVTVGSLADMGYSVDADRSDPYVVPFPNFPVSNAAPAPTARIRLSGDIWWGPIGVVDAAGSLVATYRPHKTP